jgi:hypothetical protein
MAERYNTYYRALWPASGMIGPVLTKQQLMNEIEVSLLNLGSEVDRISVEISKVEMTHNQFLNRPEDQKNYRYDEPMQ